MKQPLEIDYDQFFLNPVKDRREIFDTISPENRAFLVKTQAERWLAANRSRLTHEQVFVVEEIIQSILPEWYKTGRDFEKIAQKAEEMCKKLEAFLSHEDVLQLATIRAEHIPTIEDED